MPGAVGASQSTTEAYTQYGLYDARLRARAHDGSSPREFRATPGAFGVEVEDLPVVEGPLVLADPIDGCSSLTDASSLMGRVAFLERGTCLFRDKLWRVQAAGAIGAVIANNDTGCVTRPGWPATSPPAAWNTVLGLGNTMPGRYQAGQDTCGGIGMRRACPTRSRSCGTSRSRRLRSAARRAQRCER